MKKYVSILLVMTICTTLVVGCGATGDSGTDSKVSTSSASTEAASEKATQDATISESTGDIKSDAMALGVPELYAQDLADEGLPADYFNVNGKKPEEVTGNILYWSWDPNFFNMVQKMNDVYPNVTFDFVTVTGDEYIQKLQAALTSGGDVPDILAMEINNVGSFYDMGILEDLEQHEIDKSLLVDYTADFGTDNDGVFVGIPNTAAPGGLFYRRDLAKQYLGTDDPDEITAMVDTWEKFITVGQKVDEESNGTVKMIPGIDSFVQPLMNQQGVKWRDGNKLTISEDFIPALTTMKELSDANIDAGLDIWSASYNASFAQGNVLFYPGAAWFQSYVIEPNDPEGSGNWGVAVLPGGVYNWGGIWWGMYNQSENKDAVSAWMKYELTRQGARNKYDMIHFYPGVKSVYEDDYIMQPNEFYGGQNVSELFVKEMNEMKVLRPIADDGVFYNSVTFFAESMDGTPEEIADKIEDDIISSNPTYTK